MIDHFEPLAPEHPFRVNRPAFSGYVDRIRRGEFFSLAKINHGFWELELELRERPIPVSREARRRLDRDHKRHFFLETGFREELLATLDALPVDDPDFVFATSHVGYPGSDRIEGVSHDPHAVVGLMQQVLPSGLVPHDGMLWKRAAISGELRSFFDALRDVQVVAVGPEWLATLGSRMGLERFEHVVLPEREARGRRQEILTEIRDRRRSLGPAPAAIVFQAGSLAPWCIARLHSELERTHLFDVGRALDVCRPDVLFRYNWGRVYRRELWQGMGLEDPRRPDLEPVFRRSPGCDDHALEQRLQEWLRLPDDRRLVLCRSGVVARDALANLERRRAGRRLRFVVSGLAADGMLEGALSGARVVPCDPNGMLDLTALDRVAAEAYEGIFVSDPFGFGIDLGPYARFCERRGKVLLCDGSEALDLPDRHGTPRPPESLAFDGGQPWSVGDGGAIVIDAADEDLARELAAPPGPGVAERIGRRLSDHTVWSVRAHLQYQRVVKLARDAGLTPLGPERTLERTATPSRVPLLRATRGPHGSRLWVAPCDASLEGLTNAELIQILRVASAARIPGRPQPPVYSPAS